jgi:hypothetical protein
MSFWEKAVKIQKKIPKNLYTVQSRQSQIYKDSISFPLILFNSQIWLTKLTDKCHLGYNTKLEKKTLVICGW